ncbi:suppressor of glycerol defect [Coemansia sp. IMI 209127]|nr:suppressor of glycerol defect [Coemansia sp. IMI 209127]
MASKRRYQENTALPAKLADQISGKSSKAGAPAVAEDDGRFKKRFKNNVKTRKQARKQAREDKKKRKSDFYQRKHGDPENVKGVNKGGSNSQQPKAAKKATPPKKPVAGAEKVDERARLAKFAKRNTGMYQLLRDSNLIENVDKEAGITTGTSAADLEERELRRLERNLGMKATSKLENAFYSEGLGDLLEGISHGSKSLHGNDKAPAPDVTAERESKDRELSDESEQGATSEEEEEQDDDDDDEESIDSDEDDAFGLNSLEMDDDGSGSEAEDSDIAEMYKEQGVDVNPDLSAGENSANSDDDNSSAEEDDPEYESDSDNDDDEPESKTSLRTTENTAMTVESKVGRYIPPSLRRQQAETEDERVIAIRKVLQGQLNRLSETNIESIVAQAEALYIKYPRHHVTDVLTSILLQSIQSRSNMLDTFLYVNAALVGAVHRAVGLDPVAHLVQTMMEQFEQFFNKGLADFKTADGEDDDNSDELSSGKQCQNLAVFVAELYNFQVISCQLVYDVIRMCTKEINEFTAEILLKIIRVSGIQLRKDDPLALKEIVQQVNDEVNAQGAKKLSVRCQFMVENLMSLKDNRMRNAMSQNADNVAKLKRLLGNMDKRRSVGAVEPINIGLQDIREIETKGKWWLVGASWVGNQYTTGDGIGGSSSDASKVTFSGTQGTRASEGNLEMERLLQLARSQHMNTDVRRSIFVTLLSSDDYADAFERLLKLDLKKTQTREVVRVVLHCCGQEQAYNPYYALVAFKLCSYHSSYAHTLQYALWDFLRELGEADVGGLGRIGQDDAEGAEEAVVPLRRIVNTAKLYAWLIDKQALSLLVLKTVTFASVRQQARTFFQVLFSTLFLQHKKRTLQDTQALVAVFQKATANATMCQGMLLFFHHFVKKCEIVGEDEQPVLKWGCRVAKKVFHTSAEPSGGFSMVGY